MSTPRTAISTILALLAVLLSAVRSGPAQAQNLLTNPDFDGPGGLDLWAVQTGSMVLGADSGSCTTSGAIDASSGLSGGGDQVFWITSLPCILVDPVATPVIQLAAMYKTTATIYSRIYLQMFSDTTCSTPVGFSSFVFGGTAPSWSRIAGGVAIDSATMSVLFFAESYPQTAGAPAFTVQWDRFYMGVLPEIFLDDFEFESGSSCRWSAVVD